MLRDRPYLQNIKLGRAEDVAMLRISAESQRRAACGEATDNQSLIPDSTAAGRLGRARRSGSCLTNARTMLSTVFGRREPALRLGPNAPASPQAPRGRSTAVVHLADSAGGAWAVPLLPCAAHHSALAVRNDSVLIAAPQE